MQQGYPHYGYYTKALALMEFWAMSSTFSDSSVIMGHPSLENYWYLARIVSTSSTVTLP